MRCAVAMPLLLFFAGLPCPAEGLPSPADGPFVAQDTLAIGEEPSADARACLEGLCWPPGKFDVKLAEAGAERGDGLVRFISPIKTGNAVNDQVALEWYVARDDQQAPRQAPAVVVVHESGSGMTVGRLFAKGLQKRGVHAFLIHLPHYGMRREGNKRPESIELVTSLQQAIADVRRARDAVAALPLVDAAHVSLQGTSLGGFVTATVAGLDHAYEHVFIMLAGGDLYGVLQNGKKDAAKIREKLAETGLTDEELKHLADTIEPTRLAHRVDAERTWLYSGIFDTVVPLASAQAFVNTARLDKTHHIQMPANHYTGIVFLPVILDHIAREALTVP